MQNQGQNAAVGYVVSTWPRLSQSFVLNEVVALEQRNISVRLFSVKNPGDEPVHSKVSSVRAPVSYLSLQRHWKQVIASHARVLIRRPRRYGRTLIDALRFRRTGVMRCFAKAGYLADLLRVNPVCHLHAHFATAPAVVAMFTSELTGIPYTFTAHARDIYVDSQPNLLRMEMERAKAVVTVCEYNRDYLRERISPLSKAKVHCIYNGLDPAEFPFHGSRYDAPAPPVILTVCRLVEKKGLDDLIVAAAILRNQQHEFRVEIIGDGPLRGHVNHEIAKFGLERFVQLIPSQPIEGVRVAYKRATVFVLPCVVASDGDRDGVPTVLLEAMLSGVPVISTPVAGIPEIICSPELGVLVQPNDPPLLARALDLLLRDSSLRDRLALAAREHVQRSCSVDFSASRLASLFFAGVPA